MINNLPVKKWFMKASGLSFSSLLFLWLHITYYLLLTGLGSLWIYNYWSSLREPNFNAVKGLEIYQVNHSILSQKSKYISMWADSLVTSLYIFKCKQCKATLRCTSEAPWKRHTLFTFFLIFQSNPTVIHNVCNKKINNWNHKLSDCQQPYLDFNLSFPTMLCVLKEKELLRRRICGSSRDWGSAVLFWCDLFSYVFILKHLILGSWNILSFLFRNRFLL